MQVRLFRQFGAAVLACASVFLVPGADAQALPTVSHLPVRTSRVELYGAYSYFHPVQADIHEFYLQPVNTGAIAGVNVYFNRFLGVQAEGTFSTSSPNGSNVCMGTVQAGPVMRFQMRHVVPFVHATAGGAKSGGPVFQSCAWGWGATGGLGMDYVLPGFQERLAIRPIQADYEFNHVDHGPLVLPGGFDGGLMKMNAYRLSAGVVLRLGNVTPPAALGMSCDVTPGDVNAGEPITGKSESIHQNPHKKTTYTWHTNGGKLSGTGDTVQIDTTGLAPGNYVLTGRMEQGRLPEQQAECNAHFAVKAVLTPLSVTCSASPYSVHPGDSVAIASTVPSPESYGGLMYGYTTSAGTVRGVGPTATLNTSGAPTGTITVTCTVREDGGKTATSNTTVQVLPAVLPPAPQTQALCTIAFDRDKKRPARVDNEAKGCLDDIALSLQRQSDAHLVIVGSRDGTESPDVAAERSVNTKLYLTQEKGIDSSRIQLRTGDTAGRRVSQTLVPAGATFDQTGTTNVEESSVKSSGQPYATSKKLWKLKLKPKKKK
ncbi:hypothetical protein [Terriglobus sp. RCC_193]|uniref:hypothetical protein n=1 Tax=Terriglobus sp. RCC_193 TaxID=3239218 RepID=UPI003525362E